MRIDCFPCIRLRPPIGLYDRVAPPSEGVVAKFIRRIYAPVLLQHGVKQLVLVLFGGLFLTAIIGIQHITLGLGKSSQSSSADTRPTPCATIRVLSCLILQRAR